MHKANLLELFRERDNATKRQIMCNVINNMIENDACDAMLDIIIEQLGEGETTSMLEHYALRS